VEEGVGEMGFEPEIADEVVELDPPTETELRLLRGKIDPDRVVAGRGEIVEVVRRVAWPTNDED